MSTTSKLAKTHIQEIQSLLSQWRSQPRTFFIVQLAEAYIKQLEITDDLVRRLKDFGNKVSDKSEELRKLCEAYKEGVKGAMEKEVAAMLKSLDIVKTKEPEDEMGDEVSTREIVKDC